MKAIIITILLIFTLSCDNEINSPNTIAEDLKEVITNQSIESIAACTVDSPCPKSLNWGFESWSFRGDNFIKLGEDYYNLNQMIRYEVENVGEYQNGAWQYEMQMHLFFKR